MDFEKQQNAKIVIQTKSICTLSTAGTTVVITCPDASEDMVVAVGGTVVSMATHSVVVICAEVLVVGATVGLAVVTEALATVVPVSSSPTLTTSPSALSVFLASSSFIFYLHTPNVVIVTQSAMGHTQSRVVDGRYDVCVTWNMGEMSGCVKE